MAIFPKTRTFKDFPLTRKCEQVDSPDKINIGDIIVCSCGYCYQHFQLWDRVGDELVNATFGSPNSKRRKFSGYSVNINLSLRRPDELSFRDFIQYDWSQGGCLLDTNEFTVYRNDYSPTEFVHMYKKYENRMRNIRESAEEEVAYRREREERKRLKAAAPRDMYYGAAVEAAQVYIDADRPEIEAVPVMDVELPAAPDIAEAPNLVVPARPVGQRLRAPEPGRVHQLMADWGHAAGGVGGLQGAGGAGPNILPGADGNVPAEINMPWYRRIAPVEQVGQEEAHNNENNQADRDRA